jgi:hypothetical protein
VFWVEDAPAAPGSSGAPVLVPPAARSGGGLFGAGKKALEEENAQLRAALDTAGLLGTVELAIAAEGVRDELGVAQHQLAELQQQVVQARHELAAARREIVETQEIALLQEAGIYDYAHPLESAVAYKDLLARIRSESKDLITAGRAVDAPKTWQVDGSAVKGRKMVTDFSKLLLRAYNAEADNCVRTVKPHSRSASVERLTKAANTIARLGGTMNIAISPAYHHVRSYEIEVMADYLAKVEAEKETTRAAKERLREEQAAQREFNREKARLEKERNHVENVLARMEASGNHAGAEEMRSKLGEIDGAIEQVISRAAHVRMGYVYVISNVGAFGERMVKIGMTRRQDPMDRVRELGDASVPFTFDTHALIFSPDAVGLELRLHHHFAAVRVNLVNARREFFHATPAQVREALESMADNHLLEYTVEAAAEEWRASSGLARTSAAYT